MDDPRWILMLIGLLCVILFVVILFLDKDDREYRAWLKKTGTDKTPVKEKE